MKKLTTTSRRAFTLVELLAVIGIIALMATVIGVAFSGNNSSAALGTSQRIGASIFQSARSIAVLKQTPTRVLIYGAGTDSAKSLRFIQVVYQDPDSTAEHWIAANAGTYLPQGVYFVPNNADIGTFLASATDAGYATNALNANTYSTDYGDGNVNVYANENANAANALPAYYYEFDSNGLSGEPGGKVTFAAATTAAPPEDGLPKLAFDNQYAVMGFYLRRTGSVSLADYDYLSADPTN